MVIPEYIQIEIDHSLARHTGSMAVVNTDIAALRRYRAQRDRILNDKSEIQTLREEVMELKRLVLLSL